MATQQLDDLATILDDITRREFITGALGAGLLLAACGDDDDVAASDPTTTTGSSTTSTTGAVATTTTEPIAQRVVALDPRTLDILVALNLPVVGTQPAGLGLAIPDYVAARSPEPIELIGNGGDLNFEAIAITQPDLMIGISQVEEFRSNLEGIAPLETYDSALYAEDGAFDWRADILAVGAIVGMADEAAGLVAMLEARFAQTAELIAGKQGSGIAIVRSYGPDGYRAYGPGSIPIAIATDAGIVLAPIPFEVEPGRFVVDFSIERVPELPADHVFVSIGSFDEPGTEEQFGLLDEDPLWNAVPAVAAGNVARIVNVSAWFIGGPIGWQVMLDDLEAYFAER